MSTGPMKAIARGGNVRGHPPIANNNNNNNSNMAFPVAAAQI